MATLGIIILPEQKPIITYLSRKCYNAASEKVVESGDLRDCAINIPHEN